MFTMTRPQAQLNLDTDADTDTDTEDNSATSDRTLPREGPGPATWLRGRCATARACRLDPNS